MEANEAGNEVNEETQPINQIVPDQPVAPVEPTPDMAEPTRMAEPLPIRIGSTIDIPQRRTIREENDECGRFVRCGNRVNSIQAVRTACSPMNR